MSRLNTRKRIFQFWHWCSIRVQGRYLIAIFVPIHTLCLKSPRSPNRFSSNWRRFGYIGVLNVWWMVYYITVWTSMHTSLTHSSTLIISVYLHIPDSWFNTGDVSFQPRTSHTHIYNFIRNQWNLWWHYAD